jgi:hypothetical protein
VISRRAFVLALGALGVGCSRTDKRARGQSGATPPPLETPPAGDPPGGSNALPEPGARGSVRVLQWDFNDVTSPRAAVVVPAWGPPDARYPVVVALHGRGEALKPPADGAMGWPRDYALLTAIARVCAPPITAEDLEGFVDPARLARINADLERRPFGGLIVACPYLPDINLTSASDLREYGRFVTETLLPRVRSETPALAAPESTGIDGVSLGGATALRVGFAHPESFGAVGALQPAVSEDQAVEWTELARAARARRPTLKLRLLTSHDDYFHDAIAKTSQTWRAGGVPHEYADVPGPHDYIFNRGPGSIELLTWHDRVLARVI